MSENSQRNRPSSASKPIKRWGVWFLIPLLAGFVTLCGLSWQWKHSLKFQRVIVEGAQIVPLQEIFALTNVPPATPLCGIDLFEIRQRVLKQPYLKSVSINRKYPDAVCVRVSERKPIASINSGQFRSVDAEGCLLPYIQSQIKLDLPVINGIDGIEKAQIGQPILNTELQQAIAILQTAQALDTAIYHFISEINMNSGKDIVLYSADVGVPIILGRGDEGRKLVALQSFWSTFIKSNNAEQLRYVDLRYDDQVVVRWQNGNQQTQSKAAL